MEEMYGEQNQRSYSVGVSWIFLSVCARSPRSASASAGLVNALTKSWRNLPAWPESTCATDSGTSTALSSASPVATIPVTTNGRPPPETPLAATCMVFPSEKAAGYFSASVEPTTHSSAPSRNQRPPTFHQGCVMLAPVANFVPSGTGTSC